MPCYALWHPPGPTFIDFENNSADSWQRTSKRQVIMNVCLKPLQNILLFWKRRQRNKPQIIKSEGGGVRAAWRIGITRNHENPEENEGPKALKLYFCVGAVNILPNQLV